MADVKDQETLVQMESSPETLQEETIPTEGAGKKGIWKNMPRRKRRRIIRLCVFLVLLVAAALILLKLFGGKKGGESQVVTDVVQYGAITSTVAVSYTHLDVYKRQGPQLPRPAHASGRDLHAVPQ